MANSATNSGINNTQKKIRISYPSTRESFRPEYCPLTKLTAHINGRKIFGDDNHPPPATNPHENQKKN